MTTDRTITLNTGARMPLVGLGVYQLFDPDLIAAALQAGYRSLDTAAAYGNEEVVAEGIQRSGLPRQEIFLTTKLNNPVQRSGGSVEAAFRESLDRLGTDYVDLYLMHWPVPERFAQSWREMVAIYRGGRARAIGVSNFNIRHLREIADSGVVPAVNQIECHPHLSQKELVAYCQARGIAVEAWSPLGRLKNGLTEEPVILDIAQKYGKTPVQVILRWDLECGLVTIPKTSRLERARENLDIFDFRLSPADVAALDSLNRDERTGADPENFNF